MATVRNDATEYVETRISELEAEVLSYVTELAEAKQDNDALRAELLRLRATLEVV